MSRPLWTTSESSTSACFTEPPRDGYNTACHERTCRPARQQNSDERLATKCIILFRIVCVTGKDLMWLEDSASV